jgi:predicted nuclease with TOPRIM domain
MSEEKQTISIDPYLQNELGKLKYENIILKAQFDNVVSQNKDLQQKIQELENKLIESKEANDTSEPKN